MVQPQTARTDAISALLDSTDVVMNLAAEMLRRPCQGLQGRLKALKEFAPRANEAKGSLYENAQAALLALVNAGADYSDAEQRVKAIVGHVNLVLENWAKPRMGQAPPMPDPEKEPTDADAVPQWRPGQARLMAEYQGAFRAYDVARGDLLRMWQVMATKPARRQPPPLTDRRPPHPNETTQQPIIDVLFGMKAVGLNGLRAIPRHKRPTGERLAPKAIGRSCDGQFKATLAHMVDLGWLENGRNHGLGGGYFLTESGVALATQRRRRKARPR